MHKTWLLTKILLKSNYSDVFQKKSKMALYIFSWTMLLFVGFSFFGMIAYGMYEVLAQSGQQGVLLGMGLAVASIWVFLMSITSILTVFYYEDDIENLLPLPFQPSQIVTAKFLTVLLTQYVFSSFFLFPIVIVYGIRSGAFLTYYLYAILIYLLFPIIPLVIVSLLMMVLMRYTNLGKNKDRGRLFMGLFSIIFIVGINLFIQWNNRGSSPEKMAQLLTGDGSGLLVSVTKYFPSTYFAALSLLKHESVQGLLYLLLFAALCFLFFGIFYITAQKYYLKGVIGLSGGTSKQKDTAAYEQTTKQGSKWAAYVKKEIRLLVRTPAFFLNCIIQGFTTPVIFFFAFFMNNGGVSWLKGALKNPEQLGLALGVGFCAGMFLISSNMTATTSFSRDGSNWIANRYLPIPASTIVFAKVFTAWIVNAFILCVFAIAIVVLANTSPLFTILWLLLCLNGLWLTSLIGVRWDAQTADVHWENEQKMFKGRYTPLWNFLVNIVMAGGTVGIVLVLHFLLHVGMWIMFVVLFLIYGIVNIIVHRAMQMGAERLLRKIR
jgi:ABC-2 type transport system permease protein